MRRKAILKQLFKIFLVLGLAGCLLLFLVNFYIIRKERPYIISSDEAAGLGNVDCVMVLGCGVRPDGSPSGMLKDRLDQGIALYKEGVTDRLLMSGDHGRVNYDEVNLMKQYAIDEGMPSGDIFMDHAGFSTYESMYRARDIFQVKKIVVVTQQYHMYRALYLAQTMGMEAYGVASDPRRYGGQKMRDLRELLARPKDMVYAIVKPKPTYLGDAIPVNGDGNVTNDKEENRSGPGPKEENRSGPDPKETGVPTQ